MSNGADEVSRFALKSQIAILSQGLRVWVKE